MATTRMIAREHLRCKLAANAKIRREELKTVIKDQDVGYEQKLEAVIKLNKRPRDESPCRSHTRCTKCGRTRSVYRKFKLCRLCLRKIFTFGLVPGMRKASW